MAESASSQNLPSTSKQQPSHKTICLETHTWHTKRFRMIRKWKHKIPHYSIKNSRKDSYKAITQTCLLQDISYYTCIEIVGKKNLLGATLKKHCNPTKTFAAKMYTSGQKEGTVMFFKKNGYPQFPIGIVNFFWKLSETNIKTIWIWVHPAFYSDFLSEIISSFEFKQNNAEQDRTDISHNLNDLYTNDAGCEMRVLKYALNRFRLSGPAALTVLKEALHVPSLTELDLDSENCFMTEEQDSSFSDEKLDTSNGDVSLRSLLKVVIEERAAKNLQDFKEKMWHTKYYNESENIEAFKIQEQMWQSMKILGSPRFLPSNMIIGLTVSDPHYHLPIRTKIEVPSSAENLCCQLPPDLNRSPIWDAQIRQIVSNSCVSTDIIGFLCISSMSDHPYFATDPVVKIPILLIQKPAVTSSGLGSRIDIIIPSRWALAFWIALTMPSPLIGGLRETKLVVFESLRTYVPDFNDPDTPAYTREALKRKKKFINKYFSQTADQRVNFIKLGIHSPFFCDWKNLTKGWSDVEDFYVLRHLRLLSRLRKEIKTIVRENARSRSTVVQVSEFDFQQFDEYKNCLVQVQLSMMSEETPREFAIVCLPKRKDLRRFESNKNYVGPVERRHVDPNEKFRKILRRLHLMQLELEQVSRPGVERRKMFRGNVLPGKFDVIPDGSNRASLWKHRKMMRDHAMEMRKWYLPESKEVRHSCDRQVMGYVTMGDYSYLRGERVGIGYVALPSLLKIIRKRSNIVLVRNINGQRYRFARLEILVDINRRYKFRISGLFSLLQVHAGDRGSRRNSTVYDLCRSCDDSKEDTIA